MSALPFPPARADGMKPITGLLIGLVTVALLRLLVWCWPCRHEPMMRVRRDADGQVVYPRVIEHFCAKCWRDLGTSESLWPF